MIDQRSSKYTTIAVNIAKFTLLAALAPPVIAGIAQRASQLDDGLNVAALVASTVSLGSISAVIGALGFGALADIGSASRGARWGWVIAGTGIGTAGLGLLAVSTTKTSLVVGWILAQLGYSGAMAVLRVILAMTRPTHRRRGAVVVVLGSYGGLFLPVIILLLFPSAIWTSTFVLALISFAVPLVFVFGLFRPHRLASPRAGLIPRAEEHPPVAEARNSEVLHSKVWLLAIQCAANVVVTVFLSFHPLELAARSTDATDVPVRASVFVVAAALLGLVSATSVLLWRPSLLSHSLRVVAVAGFVLATSLIMRAFADSFITIIIAAIISGVGVGLNSSALFAAALDLARQRSGGKLMGAYSAAAALGQFCGPMIALGVLNAVAGVDFFPADEAGYRNLFACLAIVPTTWAVGISARMRRATDLFSPR